MLRAVLREHDGDWQDGGVSHNSREPCRKLLVQASNSAVIGTTCLWRPPGPQPSSSGPNIGSATTVGDQAVHRLDRTVTPTNTPMPWPLVVNNGTSLAPGEPRSEWDSTKAPRTSSP